MRRLLEGSAVIRVRRPGPGEAARARQVAAGRPDRRHASRARRRLRPRHGRRVHRVQRDRRGAGGDRRRVVLGRAGRARCGHDPRRRREDLNGTLRLSAAEARRRWPELVPVALTGDLPALRAEELDEALGAVAPGEAAYVADADGLGTTLYTAAYDAFDPRFGPGSALAHDATGRGRSGAAAPAAPRRRRPRRPRRRAGARRRPADSERAASLLGRRPVLAERVSASCGLLRGAFFAAFLAGAFFAGAFFAAFLAGAFFAGAFLAGAFFAGAFFAGAFLAGAFFAGAFFAGAFLAGAFFAGAFFAGAFFAGAFLARLLGCRFLAAAFLAGPSSRPSWQSSWSSSSSPGRSRRGHSATGAATSSVSAGSFLAPETMFFRSGRR